VIVVYKITLPRDVKAPQTQIEEVVEVEEGAEFLHAREHPDGICVWYKCEVGTPRVPRTVTVVGTGQSVPSRGLYIGTTIIGVRVGHVFVD
jgi:hypothetical protein